MRQFAAADSITSIIDSDNPSILSFRHKPSQCPPFLTQSSNLVLKEAVIVSNCYAQTRFNELSVDMFCILQTLETDPSEAIEFQNGLALLKASSSTSINATNGIVTTKTDISELVKKSRRANPRKYLLFKPTFSKFLSTATSTFKDVPANGVFLMYLSCDGSRTPEMKNKHGPDSVGFEEGGVVTCWSQEEYPKRKKELLDCKEINCIYPADLYSFTRKPFFLIVDSDNSPAFKRMPSRFGQPVVCLLSPQSVPSFLEDSSREGSIYTLFLSNPLVAFAKVSEIKKLSSRTFDKAQSIINEFLVDCLDQLKIPIC
ncbi:hypothetical protein Ciccas_002080 [Cichlidogyrus casuarinus]|uniref:Uncharacterized protein n=1 Tax=Cichlidogyrus casuarinus TaxID=1844966 RepID=A0ABD2QKI2_9PLAT